MRDFKFSFQTLNNFSNSLPYQTFSESEQILFDQLIGLRENLNFPAINNNIGSFIQFSMKDWKPKYIFEMGSGYGHSAFWYLSAKSCELEKIYLTEKRLDLEERFNDLPWPSDWREKLDYFQGDAFERLDQVKSIDLCLIDGVKGDYLKFLKEVHPKMSKGSIVLIDNSFWRGSFLDTDLVLKKKSAKNIKELHAYISQSEKWEAMFVPFIDGLSVLRKN